MMKNGKQKPNPKKGKYKQSQWDLIKGMVQIEAWRLVGTS